MKKQTISNRNVQCLQIEEVLKAMETAGKWVTKKLGGNPVYGPFSEEMLGDKAAVHFPKLAYCKLAHGDWVWKDSLSLTSQLIRIIRTEMGHILRDCEKDNRPNAFESLSNEMVAWEAEKSLREEFVMEEETKDIGYKAIFSCLKDYPELMKYVKLVRELNDYRAISKRLRIKMDEVRELEARTLKIIAEARRKFG